MENKTNMKKDKYHQMKKTLINALYGDKYHGDLSDIGNIIGLVIGKYINEGELGYEKDAFLHGLNHGFSLTDGTHDKK